MARSVDSDDVPALCRAIRLSDEDTEIKVRALPDGTLLFESQISLHELQAGYLFLKLDAANEDRLRLLLNERQAARNA